MSIFLHILHKYNNPLFGNKRTIIEHEKILNDKGAVWWGKIGIGMSVEKTRRINNQLSNKTQTKILLTGLESGNRMFHIANLIKIITFKIENRPDEIDLIPEYHRNEKNHTWFKFDNIKKVDESILGTFRQNSGKEINSALKGQSSIIYIVEKNIHTF